ncbi:IclR family transcriptional regulator [Halobacterium yunchengense]|uniref:IclR family transcriptional regulator n=1 Tax=Halobacterium yunchengense TaxID=3108497 RepID=UPI0030093013
MGTDDAAGRTIGSVDRTLRVLEALRRLDGATLAELADEVDLSKGAIHTHLSTLRQHGFVEHRGDSYALGRRFLTFGEYVRNSVPLYRAAKGEVDELAAETEECVHLITEENGEESILYEAFGDRAVGREFFLQNRSEMGRYLHYSAAGKAILAELDDERVDEIVDEHGLPAATRHTITDREAFFAELADVRERGYATNDEEDLLGIRAVGAPILGPGGEVFGALSVSAPASRLQGERFTEEFPRVVKEYVNVIEVNLQTGDVSV